MAELLPLCVACTVLGAVMGTVLGLGLAWRWRLLCSWLEWRQSMRRNDTNSESAGESDCPYDDHDCQGKA
jgi:hypothetical protein